MVSVIGSTLSREPYVSHVWTECCADRPSHDCVVDYRTTSISGRITRYRKLLEAYERITRRKRRSVYRFDLNSPDVGFGYVTEADLLAHLLPYSAGIE